MGGGIFIMPIRLVLDFLSEVWDEVFMDFSDERVVIYIPASAGSVAV